MASDEIVRRVRDMITEAKEQAGPAGTSPDDICQRIASALGVTSAVAEELVMEAALRVQPPDSED